MDKTSAVSGVNEVISDNKIIKKSQRISEVKLNNKRNKNKQDLNEKFVNLHKRFIKKENIAQI